MKQNWDERVFAKAAGLAFMASSLSLLALAPAAAAPIDWAKVQGKDITLFYPGQASWEWALTASSHSGATNFREGKACTSCHEGEQAEMGALIASGKKLEPNPIPGKRGSIPLNVKIAYDAERIYFRLSWPDAGQSGMPVSDPKYDVKATVMLDDGTVLEAVRAGCWGACHDDANEMASSVPGQDMKKYLSRSRTKNTRQGGGANYKPDAEIAAIAAEGGYLEYLQAHANSGQEPVAVHGHILKTREEGTSSPVSATASLKDGAWVVTLSRPLASSGPFAKAIVPGKAYPVGFAIHDAHASGRHHQVSFGYSFVLGQGEADIVAAKQ